VADQTDTQTSWLAPDELEVVRSQVPMVYVEAVPVRVDALGQVTHVGLLLRVRPDGSLSRTVVSGRVLHGELVRAALLRNLEKDLGAVALPRVPPAPAPFTVVEYFPDPGVTGFHDPRHHAVSLAFVVPVDGDCQPSQQSLDLAWLTPEEIAEPAVLAEMSGGHDRLVRMALAHVGCLH
jgi:ADP-ribose pyrophosphatase YjhB (NUDIX family)